ncbi:MAG: AhpC/TSA family protein [Bacteroidales bacterium]|nr:AhpC/TSA family protein [Bacteroidales bacterium]
MKKLFVLCAMVCGMFACSAPVENGYTVDVQFEGDMAQLKSDTVILSNFARNSEDLIEHKAVLADGKVSFKGDSIPTPQVFYVAVNDGNKDVRFASAYIEKGQTVVKIELVEGQHPQSVIKGGRYQTVSDSLKAIQRELNESVKMDSLMKVYSASETTPEQKARIEAIHDSISNIVEEAVNNYIESHPTSLFALQSTLTDIESIDIEKVEARVAAFKAVPEYANNKNIAKIESILATLKALQPGMQAPDFVMNDVNGKPVRFSEFYKKNKVTMVDFWASWCGPCRRFNPTLVQIHKEFKKKGFDIIGVSLDRDQESWEKAIKNDNLKWLHVSDLAFWNNAVAKQYYVRFIPQSIFVDQNGIILKRQPSEEEIVELLKANL